MLALSTTTIRSAKRKSRSEGKAKGFNRGRVTSIASSLDIGPPVGDRSRSRSECEHSSAIDSRRDRRGPLRRRQYADYLVHHDDVFPLVGAHHITWVRTCRQPTVLSLRGP